MYEFARHDDLLKKEIANRYAKNDWRTGLSPEHWDFYISRAKLTFFKLFPEFPEKPWLKIRAKDRKTRCEECRLLAGPFFLVSPERIDRDEHYPYAPTDVGVDSFHHVYAVEIDLSASKEAIIQSFERWIASVHKGREIVREKRGGVTEADLLKALGAFRLLRHFEGDWEKAAEWSANSNDEETPLYSGQSEWIKARKKVEKFMNQGIPPSPVASLVDRLDWSGLTPRERAIVKVHIATEIDRAEARRLNQLSADKALLKLLSAVGLAHKSPV